MDEWEKELRRRKKLNSLIINRPEGMSDLRRKTEFSMTTVGWIVWIFICRPLLIVLLWAIGFQFFYQHMVNLGGFAGLREMGLIYATIIFLVYAVVRGWNVYNKMRYGGHNKRKGKIGVTAEELEDFFQLPPKGIASITSMKNVSVDFNGEHTLSVHPTGREDGKAIDGHFRPT